MSVRETCAMTPQGTQFMAQTVVIALPVFGVIAIGFIAGWRNLMLGEDSAALNKFVFRFAMPAALFGLTAQTKPLGPNDITLAVTYGLAAIIVIIGSYHLSHKLLHLNKQEAGAHAFTSTLANAVFLGLPIALSVDGWDRPFVILMLVEGTLVISIGAALMAPRNTSQNLVSTLTTYVSGPMRNPLVLAMIAGFAFSSLGFSLHESASTFFRLLGQAAGPVALFSMGLFLATQQFSLNGKINQRIILIAIAKLIALPVLALTLAPAFGVKHSDYIGALALFTLLPTGIATFIMASQYGYYQKESVAAIGLTTLLSLATVSAVLIMFT